MILDFFSVSSRDKHKNNMKKRRPLSNKKTTLQLPKLIECGVESKRFESKREVATSTGKYEAFRKLSYKSSKTPTDRSFHYYPRIGRDKDWDKSISLYKNRKGGGREEWMGRSCGADAIYDTANRSPSPVRCSSSFESTIARFHDPEESFPNSRGVQSYLKIPASTTGKDVGPGSYEVVQKPRFDTSSSASFVSKSQRLFPSRVLDTSGPVSVQISDPYKYDINVMKSTEGGKFSISKRFHFDMEKPRDEEAEKKKREEEKIRKKFEEGKKMLFVDTTTTCEEVEEEEDDTEVTTIEEENKKKDTFPYVVCYTFFSSHEKNQHLLLTDTNSSQTNKAWII